MKEFLKKLISGQDNEVCSKRFAFLWVLLLITISDVVYLFKADFVSFITYLLIHFATILLIVGILHWNDIKDLFKKN